MANLLLVDDEGIHCRILGKTLARAGHEVRAVADLNSATSAVREASPDLAIVDYLLRGSETGAQVARVLRALCPGLPIIFISGMPLEVIAHELEGIAPHGFLAKPFELEALDELVTRSLADTYAAQV